MLADIGVPTVGDDGGIMCAGLEAFCGLVPKSIELPRWKRREDDDDDDAEDPPDGIGRPEVATVKRADEDDNDDDATADDDPTEGLPGGTRLPIMEMEKGSVSNGDTDKDEDEGFVGVAFPLLALLLLPLKGGGGGGAAAALFRT